MLVTNDVGTTGVVAPRASGALLDDTDAADCCGAFESREALACVVRVPPIDWRRCSPSEVVTGCATWPPEDACCGPFGVVGTDVDSPTVAPGSWIRPNRNRDSTARPKTPA